MGALNKIIMTRTIYYNGKQYNGIFVSNFSGYHDIYIDKQARLAILVGRKEGKVSAIVKLETYQIDVLLNDDEEEIEFLDELEKLEKKFENELYNE